MNEEASSPNYTDADKSTQTDAILRLVMDDFTSARDYIKRNYEKTWQDCWKCYNNIRTQRGYEGIADDFVPETFTIVESVKANVFGGKPKFNYVPLREEQEQNTEVLNNYVDFMWGQNDMTQKTLDWGQDMLVLGNGIMMASWEGDTVQYTNIPLSDFFVDPTATHMNRPGVAGYPKFAGYRFLTTVNELKNRKIVNPDTGDMEMLYTGLDDIGKNSSFEDMTDKQRKEIYIGSTLDESSAIRDQVEVIVYYTRKKKILIANRQTVIYSGDNPYSRKSGTKKVSMDKDGVPMPETSVKVSEIKGFLPFAILRNYVDTSLFYAKGDVEVILPRQESLNDVSSQKHDNLTYTMNNMWQIDPQYKHLADQIESLPGAVFPVPQGALTAIEKQSIGSDADVEMQRIQSEMRRATGADEVVQGVSQSQGRVTATEVQTQINQASQRFSSKLQTIESEGMAQLGRITLKMIQLFVTKPLAVRVVGPDGVKWQDFDPTAYIDEYEPQIQLESTTKAQKQEEGQKYAVIHQLAMNSPYVDQRELMRVYFEKMLDVGEDEIKKLLPAEGAQLPKSAPPLDAQMQAQQGQAGGQPIQAPSPVPSGPLPTGM